MLNLLKEYISCSVPRKGTLKTNPNLRKKVDESGAFIPYRGNTVVFLLEEAVKNRLAELQNSLYEAAGDMLAQRLGKDTFHMTLHDLVNGPKDTPGLQACMARTQREAGKQMRQWNEFPPLRMRGTWIFNMVNTSLVLGLEPEDEQSARGLDEMYCRLESVVPLGYGMTPHITLAYFRPGEYGPEQLGRLREVLRPVALSVELKPGQLVLQNFEDMNRYRTVE